MSILQDAKMWAVDATMLGKDALHVHVGLLVMFAVAIGLRRSLSHPLPLCAAALAAVSGEIWDIADTLGEGRDPVLAANLKDVLNTIFWPAILFALARFTTVLDR